MSSPSSWTHAAECWSSAEDAVRIANAPVIVSMDTEFWWLFYAMWMTVAYLMLSFGEPLFSFLFGLRLPRLLTWLRSGVRSLDVVERFEMETRLQVLREKLLTEHERTLDGYIIDVENRTDILENKLKAEKQLSKQLQNEINDIKLAHSHHTHQDRPRMDDNVRNLQTTLDRVNAMYRALQLVLEQYGVSEAEIASYQPAYRLPEEQSQRNADALSKRLTDVTKLYSDLRHASAEIFKENETLKAQVPKWKPYTGSVYIYEISIDETIGKLDPLTRVPKVGDNSQNDYPQTSPELPPSPSEEPASSPEEPPSSPPSSPASALEEPPSPPEEPSLLLAEPFSPPARPFSSPEDPTFASPQVAGITLLGNPLIVTSTVERDLWQWLNKYCYDVYGPILDGYQRWLRLVSTFDASIIESSLPGPNMQSETTLEHARHLQRILHNELKQYCSLYYMAEPVFDNAGSLVPSGDNTVQPARGADEPEHVPSMPDAWNAPLHNHGTFSRQVEEIIRGTGSGNEPTPIPTVPEHIPNYVDAAHLTYPQLDESSSRHSEALIDLESPDIISNHADARHLTYPRLDESSSRHNEGSSDLESPEIIPNPAGTSYGLDYSNFGVKSKSLTPPVVVQDSGDPVKRESDMSGDADPNMSLISNSTPALQPSISPANHVESAITGVDSPFVLTETGPHRLDLNGSRETEGIAQSRAGDAATTSSTQLSDEFGAGTQEISVVGIASILDSMEEDTEKQVTFQSDTIMTVSPSVSEAVLAISPRHRSVNQATKTINQCQLDDEIHMTRPQVAEYPMEDDPPHRKPETEIAAMTDSSGFDVLTSDIIMATETSTNTDIANQAGIPMTMTSEGEGPVVETSIKMVVENVWSAISNPKDETTYPETCTSMVTEATATPVSAPEDEAVIPETLTNMIGKEPIPKIMTPQAGRPTAEISTFSDQGAALMTQNNETSITEKSVSPMEENTLRVQKPMVYMSNVLVSMMGEDESAQNFEEMAVEDCPLMDIFTTNAADQAKEDLASRCMEPSTSKSNLPKLLPDETATATDHAAEKLKKNLAFISTARPVATPIPFAKRRKTPSKAPTTASSLVTLASQPSLADNIAATEPSNLIEEQESCSPQPTASPPEKRLAASPPGSTTKVQPQLGPARRPKKPVDPFIRKRPVRKTQDGTATHNNARATTTNTLSGNPLTLKNPADEISSKRGPIQTDRQEVHNSVKNAYLGNDQLQEAQAQKNLLVEGPKTNKDDSNKKRVKTLFLPSNNITPTFKKEVNGSTCQAPDAPALFEDQALEAARTWTPLQGLTEDQVIKQVSEWLVTDTHFYQKVDECTMMKNFGAFAGFEFEKLLRQCRWTTTWLNEQSMTGNNEVLLEKTQLRRTADYVQKLCAAFLEGKVKNRKDRGKSNGDRIEVITSINGMECRGYRALTKEEKRDRDEELDGEKAVDEENIRALMKWAESVISLGRTAQIPDSR